MDNRHHPVYRAAYNAAIEAVRDRERRCKVLKVDFTAARKRRRVPPMLGYIAVAALGLLWPGDPRVGGVPPQAAYTCPPYGAGLFDLVDTSPGDRKSDLCDPEAVVRAILAAPSGRNAADHLALQVLGEPHPLPVF